MTDRGNDDTKPIVPRRSLSSPTPPEPEAARRPLSERVSAAIASAGQSVSQAAESARVAPVSRPPVKPSGTLVDGPAASATRPTPAALQDTPRFSSESRRTASAAPAQTHSIRKAHLRLTHIDPWSVMKTAFLLSVALGVVTVVAVAVVWGVLGIAGVWDSINNTVIDVLGGDSSETFDIKDYVGTGRVMGFTMIVAVVDVVLVTAIATLGAFLYNLSAALLGGLEVTLAEDEH